MGMIKRDHELVESGGYSYRFAPEVDVWREVAEDRDSEASALVSISALALSGDLDPSVNLAGEPIMEEPVSSLLELSLNSDPNPPVRFSPVIPTEGAVQTLSVVGTGRNRRSVDRRSKGAIPALKSLLGGGEEYASDSIFGVAPPLATQQQFRSEDLYQSNWYRNSASDNIEEYKVVDECYEVDSNLASASIAEYLNNNEDN
ncbi:hypothetical protein AYI68_g4174 [Smittium mucronatum]|uniref:Uncharacterized protein n=1 Tax=Smittium mucronatum TaxID=133383 RepID=A0A1R0GXU9_9FUNG|nr:hypothetical protein AYI68_g4174 [Smittium mucronatum]